MFSLHAFSQDLDPTHIIIDKGKVIQLPEVNRNFENIPIEAPKPSPKNMEYNTEEIPLSLPRLTTKINVAPLKPPPLPELYGNYVKAGIGNYGTPYGEGFFSNRRSEKYSYGLHLKHFSSATGPVRFSGFSENELSGWFKHFGKTYEFYSRAGYFRNRYNFYGFSNEVPAKSDSIKHVMNTFNAMAGIKSFNLSSPVQYDLNFNYFNFSDNLKAKENEFLFSGSGSEKIDDERSVEANLMLSISSRKDSVETKRTFFQIKPAFVMNKEKYRLKAGFNIAYTNDTVNNSSIHIYPRVHVDVPLVENILIGFAGINGEMEKNTLRSFMQQNPYLESDVPLLHSNKTIELYAGATGTFKGINYRARLAYQNYKNLYFFNNSLTDSSRFTILYDVDLTSILRIDGDFSYDLTDRFRIGTAFSYFNYDVGLLDQAWHRPKFTYTLSGVYNIKKKIYINTDIYYISGLAGKNFISDKVHNLDDIIDLNLRVDYRFTNSNFAAFLELNNILSNKYQRYLYYPVKGINVIGGVAYSFK